MKEDCKDKLKKAYHTPELTVYGNVRVITETGMPSTFTDNPGMEGNMSI